MILHTYSKLYIFNLGVRNMDPIIIACGSYTLITLKSVAIFITEFFYFVDEVSTYAILYLSCTSKNSEYGFHIIFRCKYI